MPIIRSLAVSEPAASRYEIVIGLEVHAQLLTASKLFAPDANRFGDAPNQNVSVITLAHPGTLPKLNRRAVELAVRFGLATNARIASRTFFDRKNYFYPDLPKGYQVSQDKAPICLGGEVPITLKDGTEKAIPLHHTHLEEDAGKSIHEGEQPDTLLDYNRAGTPLIEIVSEPALRSAEEAAAYLTEIRNLVRALDICDGNMEEGSLRCDANVSVRLRGETRLGTRTEIKNMNSVRYLQRAIDYEAARQIELLEAGGTVVQETRNFNPDTGQTSAMRLKETLNDYRYFPEPDLVPLTLTEVEIERIRATMPPLPRAERERLQTQYGLSAYDAAFLTESSELTQFFEETARLTPNAKAVANWLMGPVQSWRNERGDTAAVPVSPAQLAALLALIDGGQVSTSVAAQRIFPVLIEHPDQTPLAIAQANGLLQEGNTEVLQGLIDEVLAARPEQVSAYRKGKKGLLGLFVGEVMKKSGGQADPKRTNELLVRALADGQTEGRT